MDWLDDVMDWLGIGGEDDEGNYFWDWDDVWVWAGFGSWVEDYEE